MNPVKKKNYRLGADSVDCLSDGRTEAFPIAFRKCQCLISWTTELRNSPMYRVLLDGIGSLVIANKG